MTKPGPKRMALSPTILAEIKSLWLEGQSPSQIGVLFGLKSDMVAKFVAREGWGISSATSRKNTDPRCLNKSACRAINRAICQRCQSTQYRVREEVPEGARFGLLTVIGRAPNHGSAPSVFARCDCGMTITVRNGSLRAGTTKSCGDPKHKATHGGTLGGKPTPEYFSWAAMRSRCTNKNFRLFHRYGGRGITICESWLASFENFLRDMGPRPTAKHTLERINNDGNYEPGNCKWATYREQASNRSDTKRIMHNGESKALAVVARECGLSPKVLGRRLSSGWDLERALTEPVNQSRARSNAVEASP